jgi:transcriptional regulator with XRE-family HTH domain
MVLNYKRIGKIIKTVRISKELSQADLAEYTELSVPYISHIETGRSKASLETIVKIANALNVSVDRLLSGNQDNFGDYASEMKELLSDCSVYEKSMIFDMANDMKKSLRKNRELQFKKMNS